MAGLAHQFIEVGLAFLLGSSSPGPSPIQTVPQAHPLTVGVCSPRYAMIQKLGREFGETPIAQGLTADTQILMEIWVNKRTDRWSITITDTLGKTCLVLSGDHYLGEPPSEAADRSPLPELR